MLDIMLVEWYVNVELYMVFGFKDFKNLLDSYYVIWFFIE